MNVRTAILLALLNFCVEASIPHFLKSCSRNHPDVSGCARDSANEAVPFFLRGVKELNIHPLTNLKLPQIYNRPNVSYSLKFEGAIDNLEGTRYSYLKCELEDFVCRAIFYFPKLETHGKYRMEGRVGSVSVKGDGNATVTLHDVTQEVIWKYSVVKRQKVDHLKLEAASLLSHDVQLVTYHFDNLARTKQTIHGRTPKTDANVYLNKKWRLLEENFTPYVLDVVFGTISKVAIAVFEAISFDELFPL